MPLQGWERWKGFQDYQDSQEEPVGMGAPYYLAYLDYPGFS